MSIDLSESIIPKSDQINFEDLANGTTATYTIRTVTKGNAEQPFNFMLVETDKAYRPSKTMRKVIVAAWGPDAAAYAGRRLTLYGEPSILFGGKKVGGLRIRAMSHIDGPLEVMAQTTRGKRETFVVQALPAIAAPAALTAESPSTVAAIPGEGQHAAQAADATPGVGGLQIASADDAARVIRAMTEPQLKKLKALLGIEGTTTKTALADVLYQKRASHFAESIHHELEGME